jgi:hypothetical protein
VLVCATAFLLLMAGALAVMAVWSLRQVSTRNREDG